MSFDLNEANAWRDEARKAYDEHAKGQAICCGCSICTELNRANQYVGYCHDLNVNGVSPSPIIYARFGSAGPGFISFKGARRYETIDPAFNGRPEHPKWTYFLRCHLIHMLNCEAITSDRFNMTVRMLSASEEDFLRFKMFLGSGDEG